MRRFPAEALTNVKLRAMEEDASPPPSEPAPSGPPTHRPPRRSYAEIDVVVADRQRDPRYEG